MSAGPPIPYELIGGEAGVRALVDRFYDLMDTLPEAATVRAMHARSLEVSRRKLFWFLSGWLGGPQLYVERFGHPRLRRRHFPFAIDTAAADQWMLCMRRALEETCADPDLRGFLEARFGELAMHMRNQPDPT
ncbi:MAG: group II truncated hemoglobin [Sandaracinaceae bacterium]|nr:group II truncated hemoglobin [Sandaracinaceae bacterium]